VLIPSNNKQVIRKGLPVMHVGLGRPSAVTGGSRGGSGGLASGSRPCSSRQPRSRPCSRPVRRSGKGSGGPVPTAEVAPSGAATGVGRRPRSRPQGWRRQPGSHRRGQRGLWGRAAQVDPWRRRSSPSVARGEEKRLKGILVSLGGKNDLE
jgi:hypothetical protein